MSGFRLRRARTAISASIPIRRKEALGALLGKNAPNLSRGVIARLTAEWQGEYEAWQKRDLSARRYVYVWADGVYPQARMEDHGGASAPPPRARRSSSASRPGFGRCAELA